MIQPLPHGVSYAVREARGGDLEPIRELGLVAFPATYAGIIEPELIQLLLAKWWTKDALIPSIRAGRAFVAEDKAGRLVGMCAYGPLDGVHVLWKLYVRPGEHGQGIGGALLTAAEERAREAGVPLRISFTEGNRFAAEFCERHAYVEVGREQQAGMPDVVWMARKEDS